MPGRPRAGVPRARPRGGAARGGFFCSRPNFWTSCRPTRSASPSPTGPSSRPRSPRTRAEPAEARAPRPDGTRPREVPTRGRGSRAGGHRRTVASASPRVRMRSGEPGAMLTPRGRKPAARRPRGARRSTPRATWSRTHRQVRPVHHHVPGTKSHKSDLASIFFSKRPKVPLPPRGRVRAIPSRARAGRVSRRILARGRTYRHPRSAGAARRARTARETTPVLFGGGDGVSVTLNRAFDAGQRTKRTPIFGAAMSGPETPARVKKETAKVRSRVRRGEHMTETTSCHGREVSPRRTPAPGSLAIAERFHDGFGTPETPVRVVTLAPRPGSSRRPKRDAADR